MDITPYTDLLFLLKRSFTVQKKIRFLSPQSVVKAALPIIAFT